MVHTDTGKHRTCYEKMLRYYQRVGITQIYVARDCYALIEGWEAGCR